MTATPEMLDAFEHWRRAELASHYASPCSDDVLNALVDQAGEKLAALYGLQASNADDFVLKIFPLMLWVFEPSGGSPPMRPELPEHQGTNIIEGYRAMMSDIDRISPAIAAAMLAPPRQNMAEAQ